MKHWLLPIVAAFVASLPLRADPLVYQGTEGPGKGKHIVFLAGDHEYRSEETAPALARLLAKHEGFKCTVLFNLNPTDGTIAAGKSNMPGMEALGTADLAVVFLRFQVFPDEQMKHLDDYLNRGGAVVGLRTSTHAFKSEKGGVFEKYSTNSKIKDYEGGFGHQVLGQTWVGHYGKNHEQSTRITVIPDKSAHPILRGVKDVWVHAGAYVGKPASGEVLTMAQPLNGMTPDSAADTTKAPMPSEWTRTYTSPSGKVGRVFTSLYGASEDLTNEGYRRLLVNGCLWAVGLEADIKPDLNVALVGPFNPSPFGMNSHVRGVKPAMYEGFSSPIPAAGPKRDSATSKSEELKGALPILNVALKAEAPAKTKGKGKQKPAAAPELPPASVPEGYRDPLPFTFQQNDVVAILGNGLADRMQHDGWTETLLYSQLPGLDLRFRNMSTSGDRPERQPRSKGQISMPAYLRKVQPTVVFAFFGYNESFDGAGKTDKYRQQLSDFVKTTRSARAEGAKVPRIVLFSPIAAEDTKDPNLPDNKALNRQLEIYAKATEDAARESGVAYVDLYHPSLELYQKASSRLTINGVHLSSEGNRQLAEVIAKALLGKVTAAPASLEKLRQVVLEKSLFWHNRYHASNGNDVWGSRSTLAFVDGQTNAEVLQHELNMLDVMTSNRDERIWACAKGKDKPVSDSNVPAPVPVISNLGGRKSAKTAGADPTYLSGEQTAKSIAVAKGFEVNLFADEAKFPQLANPVQMQVDTRGRLWAAVWPTYPTWEPLKPMKDALIIFHDDNADGKADRATEFARVQNPLGFEFWNGGVIVTCRSELLFLKDTNGDDIADSRTILLQGFDTSDTHHGANNLTLGPDGGIYWQSGVFMVHNFEQPWASSLQTSASAMYRFNPRRFSVDVVATNAPNPHGTAFDYWGYQYATDGTTGRAYQVRPNGGKFKMFELLKKEVRPVAACEVVSSTQFPDSMQGDFLICNVIGFLGLKHYHLERNATEGTVWGEPAGDELTIQSSGPNGEVLQEKSRGFLMSSDKNFRPSDAIFGADGALYVSDWHNTIIGHMQHNVRDPNRDQIHGRIYRITATGRPLQKPVAIAGQPLTALLENLKNPVDGIRHRTRIELSGRDSKEVIAAVQKWTQQFDPNKAEDAHPLLEALWLHQQHNVQNPTLLGQLLKSPELHARNAAQVAQTLWSNAGSAQKGGTIPEVEEEAPVKKSGVISDGPELTEVRVGTIREKLMFDIKEFTVKAGKKVRLTFANSDFMPHNLLVVKPGKADEIGNQAVAMGAAGFAKGFIPDSREILWSSKLIEQGKEDVGEFLAPTPPGDYPFICSFPGHHMVMRGVMKVR
ncbi:PVC-type heme-binding CxxCH protein [Verrucomicrobium spinosum]|uniref:PVC-type heme-binding CxxCH protein n=1 Tax=Verrucomicrobium spinosum TaxID=2736 RepID=UPI000174615F|nr:PVC-type heme-binding CxxCH protein [Verrucomicrobium spinosum]